MAELPNRIRELRKGRAWTLEQLAERLDCSIPQVSDLERGEIQLTYPWMRRIAAALEVEPAELLLREDNGSILAADERELVERYRAASPEQRQQLLRMSEVIVPREQRAADAA